METLTQAIWLDSLHQNFERYAQNYINRWNMEQKRHISAAPPVIMGGALIILKHEVKQ